MSRPRFLQKYGVNSPGYERKTSSSGFDDFADSMPRYEDFSDDPNSHKPSDFEKGMRVRHPTFGVGSIYAVEGSGDMQKVSVMFQDRTAKKFVAKYARLERV